MKYRHQIVRQRADLRAAGIRPIEPYPGEPKRDYYLRLVEQYEHEVLELNIVEDFDQEWGVAV